MTVEACRHLRPDVILAIRRNEHRGEEILGRLDGLAPLILVSAAPVRAVDRVRWRQILECDTIYTAETTYLEELPVLAEFMGRRLVVHAMPEYYGLGPDPTCDVWVPTPWLIDHLPAKTKMMPVPVDRDRCAPRPVDQVRRVLFQGSGAMLDRNGWQLVAQALSFCRTSFELVVSGVGGTRAPLPRTTGAVTVTPADPVRDYWRQYDDVDALVMPRRYGGLSLPMQEAASCGLPVVSLDVDPQRSWLHPDLAVPSAASRPTGLLGGAVRAAQCRPADLALALDGLVAGDPAPYVAASLQHAQGLDWADWQHVYREELLGEGLCLGYNS